MAEPFLDDTSHSTCSAFKNSSRSVSVNVPNSRRTYLTHSVCVKGSDGAQLSVTVIVYCPTLVNVNVISPVAPTSPLATVVAAASATVYV